MIYLDYAASCPINKEVLDIYYKTAIKYFANTNSSHKKGLEAREILNNSTNKISELLKIKSSEIIYTSGASESNNLAIKGVINKYKNRGKHIIVTTLDHSSVIGPLDILAEENFLEVENVNILKNGLVDLEDLEDLEDILREDTLLVSIPYVDSEIGIKQPIEEIGALIKKKYPNCIFFSDATQAVGKINIDTSNVDLMTIAPRKFYGLNSIGILIKKENIELSPLIIGGKSTTIYRSGTPDIALVCATQKALEIALENIEKNYEYIKILNKMVKDELKKYKNININSNENSIPHTLNVSMKDVKSIYFAKELEKYEIYVSTKTACCPTNKVSRSVYEITKDKKLALSTLRISFSHLTTIEEIEIFLKCFKVCYDNLINKND